jgi:hypothetical protein
MQRSYELLLDIGNGAMNFSKLATLQKDLGTSVQPLKKPTPVPPVPTARWISFTPWQFVSKQPTTKQGGALNLKGLSKNVRPTDFSENIRASLFNDDQSNEPTLSQIHLAGQSLQRYVKIYRYSNSSTVHVGRGDSGVFSCLLPGSEDWGVHHSLPSTFMPHNLSQGTFQECVDFCIAPFIAYIVFGRHYHFPSYQR